MDSLLDSIISIYHTHVHPAYPIHVCKAAPRDIALKYIAEDYAQSIIDNVEIYRSNPKMTEPYFNVKGLLRFGRSFLDKYGEELGKDGDRLNYLIERVGPSVDDLFQARKYAVDKINADNVSTLNNRMFVLTIISIGVAFFAGSILNDSLGEDAIVKSVIVIIGAAFVLILGWIAIRWADAKSRDDQYDEDGDDRYRSARFHRLCCWDCLLKRGCYIIVPKDILDHLIVQS